MQTHHRRTTRRDPGRRGWSVLLSLAVLGLTLGPTLSAPGAAAATGPGARAEWVWTHPSPRTLVDQARTEGVTELFVSVPPDLGASPDLTWVRSVSERAHAVGIRVAALGGDPGWVDDPAAGVAWARSALATGLFDGLHVDVEPWVRADWTSRRAAVVDGYLEVLRRLQEASTLPLEADVAFWLDTVATSAGGPLDDAVAGLVDALTVMSYRTTATGPDSITAVGAHALATGAAHGIPVRLAVETHDLRPDPDWRKQTFFGQRRSAMALVTAAVDRASAGSPAYRGIAVEDHAGWTAMKP
ncbi:MAG: hypothetical protein JWR20_1924 [Marmoricola sp.]|nr:hypothetical protein [Marmoricola sp.]